jgi:hypothetical protein
LVVLVAAVAMWSCSSDPTESGRGADLHILAEPASLFIDQGEAAFVTVKVVDGQGNTQDADFQATAASPAITVTKDEGFLPVPGGNLQTEARFNVVANDFTATSFTVTGGGAELEIPVRVIPAAFTGTFSSAAPALGEPVTLTAPAGLTFGAETGITFPGAAGEPSILGISEDSTVLTFLPAPGTDTTGLVSGLVMSYAPEVPLDTLETATKITTPAVDNIPAVFSSATPAANETVTMTATGFKFLPGASIAFAGDTAATTAISADSLTLSFVPAPGDTGVATVTGAVLSSLVQIPLVLPTTTAITVGPASALPGTDDPGTAPTLPVPPVDLQSRLFDAPDFAANIDRWYRFDVTEEGIYTIRLDWDIGSDIDLVVCDEALEACDGQAATGNVPEIGEFALTPGTYFVLAEDFGEDAAGATIQFFVDHAAPEAAALRAKAKVGSLTAVRRAHK